MGNIEASFEFGFVFIRQPLHTRLQARAPDQIETLSPTPAHLRIIPVQFTPVGCVAPSLARRIFS